MEKLSERDGLSHLFYSEERISRIRKCVALTSVNARYSCRDMMLRVMAAMDDRNDADKPENESVG